MEKQVLYTISSPFRGEFKITGYSFGQGAKTLAVVGAMRGDEIQQQYVCSLLVSRLEKLEKEGKLSKSCNILVIPSCNPFSMNVEKRFWPMDNTDINRMFPGYDKGETTQRIAQAIFSQIKDYTFGIQLASFYMPGNFVPHVRMLETGYQDITDAKYFELPYIYVRKPRPYDSTMLNYNWQIWNTCAFSIYAGGSNTLDIESSNQTVESILRFLSYKNIIHQKVRSGYNSTLIKDKDQVKIRSQTAGFFHQVISANKTVNKGDLLAEILDPSTGKIIKEIKSPINGVVFFAHYKPTVLENTVIYRIIK